MRLADFIDHSRDDILEGAEKFARTLPTLADAPDKVLRDHFSQCLDTISKDMRQSQSRTQSIAKSHGKGPKDDETTAAQEHGAARANSGLTTSQLVSEFRALRSSVLRLWFDENKPDEHTVSDVMRFNEAIDQTLAESVVRFEQQVEHWRHIFLGVVGHDLRTPLNAVALTAQLLGRKVAAEHRGQTDILVRGVKRIGGMLDSLLDYADSQIGADMRLSKQRADLADACRDEIDLLRAAHPQAEIRSQYGAGLEGVFDVSRVREALSNLVANAIQHGIDGHVDVHVEQAGGEFVVRVVNAGHIPESELAGIFEPLKRGGNFKTGHRTNLGLGLFICKQIASAHGGDIRATSQDGEVTFDLRWPAKQT